MASVEAEIQNFKGTHVPPKSLIWRYIYRNVRNSRIAVRDREHCVWLSILESRVTHVTLCGPTKSMFCPNFFQIYWCLTQDLSNNLEGLLDCWP